MSVDLTDWVIAFSSKTLIGKRLSSGLLSPVYELEAGIVQGPRGETGIAHRCVPLCWLLSADSVLAPPAGTVLLISALSRADQDTLARSIENCQQVISQMRAAQSGIVVAPESALSSMPKVH
jgi:hypothetical protein